MEAPTAPRGSRVGIVGAGRLGLAVAAAAVRAGHELVTVSSRSAAGRAAARTRFPFTAVVGSVAEVIAAPGVEVVVVCVPDDAAVDVAGQIAGAAPRGRSLLVVSTSGAVGLHTYDKLADLGHDVARMHPLHVVTAAAQDGVLDGVIAGVTGSDDRAAERAGAFARSLRMRPFSLDEDAAVLWHAAASVAANHVTALLAAARDIAVAAGVDERSALDGLGGLATAAIAQAVANSPEVALTGPVVRGDTGTIAAHLEAIDAVAPDLADLYRATAAATLRLAIGGRRLEVSAAGDVRAALAAVGVAVEART